MISSFLDVVTALAAELAGGAATAPPWNRLLARLQLQFGSDACALLALTGQELHPLATLGLSADTIGRRFPLDRHPRLAAIVHSVAPLRFPADSPLPDPYDGLVDGVGQPEVHDCLGVALRFNDRVVGVITLDSLEHGRLSNVHMPELIAVANLTAAFLVLKENLDNLRDGIERHHLVSQALMEDIERSADIIGQSPQIEALRRDIETVAASDLAVLILGETGVGKELTARRIHARSLRASQPLIYVNCAALPENLIESELFGHVRGAFTGAVQDRRGRFEIANGGTLFLDEIGELSIAAQAKLLRVLQSGEVQRVGSDRNIATDVRLIAATNQDLVEEVRQRRFRADLYHRIAVYPLHVPALRDRPKDILPLAGHFLERSAGRLRLRNVRLAKEAERVLLSYAWPGNVRELEHVMSRAALKAASDNRKASVITVTIGHLGLEVPDGLPADQLEVPQSLEGCHGLREATVNFQRAMVKRVLHQCGGNASRAADRLKMDRGNFSRLLRRLGLADNNSTPRPR